MLVRSGRPEAARQHYSKLARDARQRGDRGFESFLLLRRSALELTLAERMVTPAGPRTLDTLDSLIASDLPENRTYADAARMVKAGFMARRGDEDALEAAIVQIRTSPDKPPQLLYAPAIKLDVRPAASTPNARFLDAVDDNWADIGFFVKPDGYTADVQILRTGKQFEKPWADRVMTSIAGRRYAPRAMAATDPGSFRVERFTYTSDHQIDFGSRLVVRPNRPTIQRVDLTVEQTASR